MKMKVVPWGALNLQVLEHLDRELDVQRIGLHSIPHGNTFKVLKMLAEKYGNDSFFGIASFTYGVMCGKRQERAKRRRAKRATSGTELTGSVRGA